MEKKWFVNYCLCDQDEIAEFLNQNELKPGEFCITPYKSSHYAVFYFSTKKLGLTSKEAPRRTTPRL